MAKALNEDETDVAVILTEGIVKDIATVSFCKPSFHPSLSLSRSRITYRDIYVSLHALLRFYLAIRHVVGTRVIPSTPLL